MSEAVIAGAVAGAVAGLIAALAVLVAASRGARPGQPWVFRSASTHGASQFGSWRDAPVTSRPQPSTDAPRSFAAVFDESGQRVLDSARSEAIRANHNYIGTEHLLLGLLVGDQRGPAGRALERHGVSLDKARTALEFIVGCGDSSVTPAEITMSPRTQRVFGLATVEARQLGRVQVGAAEILLGLIAEGEGIATGIIESLGVRLDVLRATVLEELGHGGSANAATQPPLFHQPQPGMQRRYSGGGPFDRFNDRAKRVLALAQDEAIRFNHNYIGPEHIVLGLIREGEGVAGRVLSTLGADLARARQEVEHLVGRGDTTTSPSEITLAPRTKKLIELAIDESRILAHNVVGTEHLLLGILRDPTSNAGEILRRLGVDLEAVRARVIAMLSNGDPRPPT